MCGIAAILNISPRANSIEKSELGIMADAMLGRGPDAGGIWLSEEKEVGITCRRLSTQDARPIANQPLLNNEQSVAVVLNGEIYNHNELRDDLEKRGCAFRTRSDTEVLANGYHVYGRGILNKIKGQFAFVAYDTLHKKALIARDPMGICPLYFTIHNGQLILASTVKAILELNRIPKRLDHQAVYDFFVMDSVGRKKTLYRDISYLRSGYCMSVKVNEPPEIKRFHNIDDGSFQPIMDRSESHWIDEVRQLLNTAVKKCMLGDKEVGLYLSGGIDSLSILALLREVFPNRVVQTFSAGFEHAITGEIVGEAGFARKMAAHYNTQHHEVNITDEDIVGDLGEFELPPSSILNSVIKRLAVAAAEANVNVALSGEGSDEIFFGYDHFMASVGFLAPDFHWLKEKYTLRNRYASSLNAETARLEDLFLGGGVNIDIDVDRKNIFKKSNDLITVRSFVNDFIKEMNSCGNSIEIDKQMIYIDFSHKFPENFLRRAEGPSMGEGVEMRFPFLWDDLISLMYRMPMAVRISDGTFKYILRKAMRGILPDQAINRPKSPFGIPASRGFYFNNSGPVYKKPALQHLFWKHHRRLSNVLTEGAYRQENIFVDGYIERIVDQQTDYDAAHFNTFLWKVWNFAEWYENWF